MSSIWPLCQPISPTILRHNRVPGRPRCYCSGDVAARSDLLPPGEFVRKPYHYGPLIRKIEELLASYQQSVARAA